MEIFLDGQFFAALPDGCGAASALAHIRASAPEIEPARFTAPAPPPAGPIGWMAFMALFTPAEQAAAALSADPAVAVFRMMATGLGEVTLADPQTAQGLDALVSAGCLASARKARILAGLPPE